MRRLRNDLPYTFRPPKMKRWMRPLVLAVNRMMQLKRQYRIHEIEDGVFTEVGDLARAGHSVLLAPNHSDHSAPHVIMELITCCTIRRLIAVRK